MEEVGGIDAIPCYQRIASNVEPACIEKAALRDTEAKPSALRLRMHKEYSLACGLAL